MLAIAVLEWIVPCRRLHFPTWVFNALYVPVYLTVAGLALYPVAQLIAPRLPVNLLGLQFEKLGPLGLARLVLLYLCHGWSIMWRYHRFHHADCNVAVTTATRHHWFEELNRYFFMFRLTCKQGVSGYPGC